MAQIQINTAQTSINGHLNPVIDPVIENRMSIGDEVTVVYSGELIGEHQDGSDFTFDDLELTINPAMFVDSGVSFFPRGANPLYGYFCRVANGQLGNIKMDIQGRSSSTLSNDNAKMTLEVLTNRTFNLTLVFIMTADLDGFLSGRTLKNKDRLSKNSFRNLTNKNNYISVYNSEKDLALYFYAKQGKTVVYENKSIPFSARWYNEGIGGGVNPLEPQLTRVDITIDGNPVSELSRYKDSKIEFVIESKGYSCSNCRIAVYKRKKDSNVRGWIEDLDFLTNELVTEPADVQPPEQIAGILYTPSEIVNGANVTISATVNSSLIEPDASYLIIVMPVMSNGGDDISFSFVTQPLGSSVIPDPLELTLDAIIEDYGKSGTDKAILVPEERIRITLKIPVLEYNQAAFAADGNFSSFNNDWRGVVLCIVDSDTDEVLFTHNYSRLAQQELDDNDQHFRIYQADNNLNVEFSMRIPWLNNQGHPDWSGRTLNFDWSVLYGYSNPNWRASYNYQSKITVREYDNDVSQLNQWIEYIKYFDADTGLPIGDMCAAERLSIVVKLWDSVINEGFVHKVIALVDKVNYGSQFPGSGSIKEFESHVSEGGILDQLEQEPIVLCPEVFDQQTGIATFILDLQSLEDGIEWRVSAIAKRFDSGSEIPINVKLTESGEPKLTENGEYKLID